MSKNVLISLETWRDLNRRIDESRPVAGPGSGLLTEIVPGKATILKPLDEGSSAFVPQWAVAAVPDGSAWEVEVNQGTFQIDGTHYRESLEPTDPDDKEFINLLITYYSEAVSVGDIGSGTGSGSGSGSSTTTSSSTDTVLIEVSLHYDSHEIEFTDDEETGFDEEFYDPDPPETIEQRIRIADLTYDDGVPVIDQIQEGSMSIEPPILYYIDDGGGGY